MIYWSLVLDGKTLAGKLPAAGKRLPWWREILLCLAGLVSISAVFQPRLSLLAIQRS